MPCVVLNFLSLATVFIFAIRVLSLSWSYGIVEAKIPVMQVEIEKSVSTILKGRSKNILAKTTPVIVLAYEAMYFGDMKSMTESFSQVRDKYKIEHNDGSPQVDVLIEGLKKWHWQRNDQYHIKKSNFAILVPGEQWPIAIVMQIIEQLKSENIYKDIILATGFS